MKHCAHAFHLKRDWSPLASRVLIFLDHKIVCQKVCQYVTNYAPPQKKKKKKKKIQYIPTTSILPYRHGYSTWRHGGSIFQWHVHIGSIFQWHVHIVNIPVTGHFFLLVITWEIEMIQWQMKYHVNPTQLNSTQLKGIYFYKYTLLISTTLDWNQHWFICPIATEFIYITFFLPLCLTPTG